MWGSLMEPNMLFPVLIQRRYKRDYIIFIILHYKSNFLITFIYTKYGLGFEVDLKLR